MQVDHITAFSAGGATIRANTAPLCPRHHEAKSRRHFSYTRNPDGSYAWRSWRSGQSAHTPAPRPYD